MDWLDLLAVQGTLKSLLQYHNSKTSILRHSAFFIIQLSYLYVTTGKTIALTRWTFVGKVMSLLFNMLSRLVITFLSRTKVSFNFMAVVTICSDFRAQKTRDEYNSWFLTSASHHMHILTIYLSFFFFLIFKFILALYFLFSFFGCMACGNLSFLAKDLTGTPGSTET